MEIKNHLKIGALEFKITAEKLYIETVSGSETYALRSINGISVKDNIDGYNVALSQLKARKMLFYFIIVVGIIILVLSLGMRKPNIGMGIMGILFSVFGIIFLIKDTNPRMESIVRITMNSGDKAFSFFKDDANSAEVADFVATLENTLTAFHKE